MKIKIEVTKTAELSLESQEEINILLLALAQLQYHHCTRNADSFIQGLVYKDNSVTVNKFNVNKFVDEIMKKFYGN